MAARRSGKPILWLFPLAACAAAVFWFESHKPPNKGGEITGTWVSALIGTSPDATEKLHVNADGTFTESYEIPGKESGTASGHYKLSSSEVPNMDGTAGTEKVNTIELYTEASKGIATAAMKHHPRSLVAMKMDDDTLVLRDLPAELLTRPQDLDRVKAGMYTVTIPSPEQPEPSSKKP